MVTTEGIHNKEEYKIPASMGSSNVAKDKGAVPTKGIVKGVLGVSFITQWENKDNVHEH